MLEGSGATIPKIPKFAMLFLMSRTLLNSFLFVLVFATGFIYLQAQSICPVPIAYHLGVLDPEFELTVDEARTAISTAESLWEDATGLNLFTHDPQSTFTVNFIFDERQANTNAMEDFESVLNEAAKRNQAAIAEYEALLAQYEALDAAFQSARTAYERSLRAYNAEVDYWNEQGGAPTETFAALNAQQRELDREGATLEDRQRELNQVVDELNQAQRQVNQVVSNYNQNVGVFNDRFSEPHEFTQGDYQGQNINIYQFATEEQLQLVLAHELGHALGIGHVPGETSIMYEQMGEQSLSDGLTEHDLAAFVEVCGDGSFWARLTRVW